ncbi:uncharacterized protein B0H18DRAFT_49605 [Fomitopsis serialis]|uniref:uncharacterized protein n=1 Tax=Fomitopsis serialis TaxID=139415 RepID=UPI002007E90B|nr:uncharacterized protein B0H18DRAFT_49605 [Neoantrodia serialis]KAH9932188.1 hypothetical protein B0H18DRAFT_49605 [Neoantrodia serialis]
MDPNDPGGLRARPSTSARKTGGRSHQAAPVVNAPAPVPSTTARKEGRPGVAPPPVRMAPPVRRPPGMATKIVAQPPGQLGRPRADRARQPPAVKTTARKQSAPAPPNRGQPNLSAVAPAQAPGHRTTKTILLPPWLDDTNVSLGNRRRRDADDIGGRMGPRMGISNALIGGHRRVQAGPAMNHPFRRQGQQVPGNNGYFIGENLTVRVTGSDEAQNDRDDGGDYGRYRPQQATKGARKQVSNPIVSGKAARKTAGGEVPSHAKAARKSQILVEPDDVIDISDSDDDGIDQLASALDALTLAPSRLQEFRQLPFLRRNLCQGYKHHCKKAGINTAEKIPPTGPVSVIYRYDWDDGAASGNESDHIYEEWQGSMVTWSCPLCRLHGHFDTREMLAYHLRRDHNEVKVCGTRSRNVRSGTTWQVVLTIPDAEDDSRSSVDEGHSTDSDDASDVPQAVATPESLSPSPVPMSPIVAPQPQVQEADEQLAPQLPIPPEVVDEVPPARPLSPMLIPKKAFRAPSPTPSTSAQATTRTRSTTGLPRRHHTVSTRGSLPARYPSPPPRSEPLGPAAQYPYIPEGDYSCRPGGPKVYDLLNTMPLEQYGVLSWMIVDREEELFELDDVRDEDKVMMALWNRWIMLNRPDFIFKGYSRASLRS